MAVHPCMSYYGVLVFLHIIYQKMKGQKWEYSRIAFQAAGCVFVFNAIVIVVLYVRIKAVDYQHFLVYPIIYTSTYLISKVSPCVYYVGL